MQDRNFRLKLSRLFQLCQCYVGFIQISIHVDMIVSDVDIACNYKLQFGQYLIYYVPSIIIFIIIIIIM